MCMQSISPHHYMMITWMLNRTSVEEMKGGELYRGLIWASLIYLSPTRTFLVKDWLAHAALPSPSLMLLTGLRWATSAAHLGPSKRSTVGGHILHTYPLDLVRTAWEEEQAFQTHPHSCKQELLPLWISPWMSPGRKVHELANWSEPVLAWYQIFPWPNVCLNTSEQR